MTQISIVQSKSKTIQATGPVTGAANNGSGAVRLTVVGHGLESGDWVQVAGVGGVPAATGQFQVAVIASSTYDLIGSTFGGSFSSGEQASTSVIALWPASAPLIFCRQIRPWCFCSSRHPQGRHCVSYSKTPVAVRLSMLCPWRLAPLPVPAALPVIADGTAVIRTPLIGDWPS